MTQAFRQMPRRVGSRPGVFRKVDDSFQESPAIQSLLRQASQLDHHIQQLPASSAARGILQKKLASLHDQLHHLRSEARALALTAHTQSTQSTPRTQAPPAPTLPRPFFQHLYTEKHPLPRPLRSLYQAAVPQQVLADFHQALQPLYEALISQEQQAWKGFWMCWLPGVSVAQDAEGVSDGQGDSGDGFEVLTFKAPPRPLGPRPRPALYAPVQAEAGLQVSFDLSAGKSTVRNAMGIAINQVKKSYSAYLKDGFQAIDKAVASGFEERYHLEHGVMAFLEAMSLDKSRHEAYFGLGYLYALVQDANHALYFLGVAYQISQDPAIAQLKTQVKAQLEGQLGLLTPVSA